VAGSSEDAGSGGAAVSEPAVSEPQVDSASGGAAVSEPQVAPVAGAGVASGSGPGEPVQIAPAVEQFAVVPGSMAEVAASVAARFLDITRAELREGRLTVELTTESLTPPGNVKAEWQATMFGAVLRDQLAANGEDIGGAAVFPFEIVTMLTDPAGRQVEYGAGLGNTVLFQKFEQATEAELVAAVEAGAAKHGLTVTSIEVFHPQQTALAVRAVTADPAKTVGALFDDSLLFEDLIGRFPDLLEGMYYRLDDANGDTVMELWRAPRAGAAGSWFRADVDERSVPEPPPSFPEAPPGFPETLPSETAE
jgi:hypothetical protein